MNNIVAGMGDVLLRYPELIEELTWDDRLVLGHLPAKFVAVHPFASTPNKALPDPYKLCWMLCQEGIPFVILGNEQPADLRHFSRVPGEKFMLHLAVLRFADKFIGSLSCFNVAAHLLNKRCFTIVNRSIKEPFIYGLMERQRTQVRAWNDGHADIESIYLDAVDWARL